MELTGRLYFDFVSSEVWRFYRMLLTAQEEGARIGLEWKPVVLGGLPPGPLSGHARLLAASEVVRQDMPLRHGRFVPAVLIAIHHGGASAEDPDVLPHAARAAGLEDDVLERAAVDGPGRVLLQSAQDEAEALGVAAVPTLYRHGPLLTVRTTGAAALAGAADRLDLIVRVLEDDGLWELRKPS